MTFGGTKFKLKYSNEGTPGTKATTGFRSPGRVQGTPTLGANLNYEMIHGGGLINPQTLFRSHVDYRWSFEYQPQDAALLIGALGSFDTTSPVTNTSNYQHWGGTTDSTSSLTTPVENEADYFTFSWELDAATDDVFYTTGTRVNTINLTSNADSPVSVTMDGFMLDADHTTSRESASELDYGPWGMIHAVGDFDVDGSPVSDITELTLNVSNDMKVTKGWQAKPEAILQGHRTIEGTHNYNYNSLTQFYKFADDTGTPTEIAASGENTEYTIDVLYDNQLTTTIAGYRAMRLVITGAHSGDWERGFPTDGSAVKEKFDFKATKVQAYYWDATSADPW